MHREKRNSNIHSVLSGIGLAALAVVLGAVVLHFAWNMAMPDLFGAAKMSFKNAVGLMVLLSLAGAAVGRLGVGRSFRGRIGPANEE